jgi:hypothetical protein
MKIIFRSLISIILASMTLSVSATPLTCDPMTSCGSADTWQHIDDQSEMTFPRIYVEKQIPEYQSHNMLSLEREILFELMESQAEDRQEIRKTARLALINLQQLAASDRYNQSTAKELAMIYGSAMAKLAYLDIQLAVEFRNILSKKQLKEMQD